MDLNWLESFLYGLFSGLADILPVSPPKPPHSDAEMLRHSAAELMKLFAHLGVFGAMYFSCRNEIVRIHRARRLARVPTPPPSAAGYPEPDGFQLLRTMLIP